MSKTTNFIGGVIAALVLVFVGMYVALTTEQAAGAPVNRYEAGVWHFGNGFYIGLNQQASFSNTGTFTTSGNIIQTTGSTIVNNLVQGSAGYALTLSSANPATTTITAAQWCSGTQILIPVSNTTTVGMILPAASTTFATCGAVAGSWATQIITNESSFPVFIATSTGGNGITFLSATGTTMTSYPPRILASTTEIQVGTYTSSSALNMLRQVFYRISGI